MNPAILAAVVLGLGAAYVVKVFVLDKSPAKVNALTLAKQIQAAGGSVVATSPNLLGPEKAENFQEQGGARFWKKELAPQLSAALASLDATPHGQVKDVWMLGPDKAMSKVTAAQLMTFADKSAAILPVLT